MFLIIVRRVGIRSCVCRYPNEKAVRYAMILAADLLNLYRVEASLQPANFLKAAADCMPEVEETAAMVGNPKNNLYKAAAMEDHRCN
jgi:hypothetical protein